MHHYQRAGAEFLATHPQALLYADMGLGKTVMTLTALNHLLCNFAIRKVLIVSTIRVIQDVWPAEIAKWEHTQWLQHVILRDNNRGNFFDSRPIHLINYEMLIWFTQQWKGKKLDKLPYDLIVFDEISKIAAQDSRRHTLMRRVVDAIPYRWGLTASPAAAGLMRLYGQMRMIDGGHRLGGKFGEFREKYFYLPHRNSYDWTPFKSTHKKLTKKIAEVTMVMEESEHLSIPPYIYNPIHFDLPVKIRRLYNRLKQDLYVEIDGVEIEADNEGVLAGKLRQISQGTIYTDPEERTTLHLHDARLEVFKETMDGLENQNVLVIYEYRHDMDAIRRAIPDAVFLDDPNNDEKEVLAQWGAGKIRVLAVHPVTAGTGLNLQAGGNHLVWYCLSWNYELYEQMIGRLRRQGQEHRVVNHVLLANDTIDERVVEVLEERGATQQDVKRSIKKHISKRKHK
jgi:SNF2 family DNA or RNA helicase